MKSLEKLLTKYRDVHALKSKGQLAVMLHITRLASENGLPIHKEVLRTDKTGQVKGLGKSRVQNILKDHGLTRILAEEGGRTSRGSLGTASDYIIFLNSLHNKNLDDLKFIEKWWIERVKDYFNSKPFILNIDPGKSLASIVIDLLSQATKRQKDNPGTTYAGTVLQHLIGAKLDLIISDKNKIIHHGANVADIPTSRAGDFVIENSVIHVTTAPSEALIRKCKNNIEAGLRPIIITITESRPGIESIAKSFSIDGRIEIIEAEQFIASNILEWSKFASNNHRIEIIKLISRYNEIIEISETDLSLKINY